MMNQRADLAYQFMDSLDKEYEYVFSDNLMLLCKYSFNIPLTAEDIIRMAKTFEYTKTNYIKGYPDLFKDMLKKNIKQLTGNNTISINAYITNKDFSKLPKEDVELFANMSIMDETIKVPLFEHSFKLKKCINELLNTTHEDVKAELARLRKEGKTPQKAEPVKEKTKEILTFDPVKEKELLKEYNLAQDGSLNQHFTLVQLQDFYYRYRSIDEKYLNTCVNYCLEDLSKLVQYQQDHVNDERKRISDIASLYSKKEVQEMLDDIRPFEGNIPAFKRLAIIYEKQNDYNKAVSICDSAIDYYYKIGFSEAADDFTKRKNKLLGKMGK